MVVGYDFFRGTISEALGPGVKDFRIGDDVTVFCPTAWETSKALSRKC